MFRNMSRTSLALGNLRAFVILLVAGFHSSLAYVVFQPPLRPFSSPPWDWRAFPILDHVHWFGLDLFCAFQYVFLMPFMFFLSGLFVWQSIARKGVGAFLSDRLVRIGIPFALGVYLLMPVAHYPVYRLTAPDPSLSTFWAQWIALPFWASGPLWFLWHLLVLDMAAAALYRFAPGVGERLGSFAARAGDHPARYFVALAIVSALAYLPLAAIFQPWDLRQVGPFAFQPGRVLHYVVYFFAGVSVGMVGIERGLLRADGLLQRRWALWSALALVAFPAWMLVTALTMENAPLGIGPLPQLDALANLVFVLASATACFAFAAVFLRFAGSHRRVADSLSANAYGIYLVHYLPVIWLQYLLLGLALPAVVKAAMVFGGALLAAWSATAAMRCTRIGAHVLGADRRVTPEAQQVPNSGYSASAVSPP